MATRFSLLHGTEEPTNMVRERAIHVCRANLCLKLWTQQQVNHGRKKVESRHLYPRCVRAMLPATSLSKLFTKDESSRLYLG